MIRGLYLDVARTTLGDSTNGGLSSVFDRLLLVGVLDLRDRSGINRPVVQPLGAGFGRYDPEQVGGYVAISVRELGEPTFALVPVDVSPDGRITERRAWYMFGGNYAGVNDTGVTSVLRDLTGRGFYGAMAIHDRREG